MAQIHNSNLINELRDVAKLQQLNDIIPSQLADKVVPVIDVNPKHARIVNWISDATASNATSANFTSLPDNKEFYLTSATLSLIKDATATSTLSRILLNLPDGSTKAIISIPSFTLTAQNQSLMINFNPPIFLQRGQTITVSNSTNVGNIKATGNITGYTVDNINA